MSRKPTSQRKRQSNQSYYFDFQKLEPRQMLSATAPDSAWPAFTAGQLEQVSIEQSVQENFIRKFLNKTESTMLLQEGDHDLRLIEVNHGLASTTTRFQQTYQGIPVFGAFVTVNQGPDGQVQQVHNQAKKEFDFIAQKLNAPVTAFGVAEQRVIDSINTESLYSPTRGELVWYDRADGKTVQAWQLSVYSSDRNGDFLSIVDAESNHLLHLEDRRANAEGSGHVFEPNPWQTQGDGTDLIDNNDANSTALENQLISVTLEGLDEGTGLLIGEFVDLATLNSDTLADEDADEADRVYEYTRDDARFEQVVVYHSVDQINRYFHTLGFDDDSGTANGIRDFATLANAHWYDQDQSFYSTGDDAIHFGDGGVDDGEDADIIAHEYGHAIQHNQNAAWGGGEMGAMGEGFGDYLAAAFYKDFGDADFQALHAPAVGEWDATSYSSDDPPNLRRVDGTKVYPDDLTGAVHADGEIWSRALWDINLAIGNILADQVILESHFGLPGGATMPVAAEAILLADQNINGGANQAAIRQAFVDRGILEAPSEQGDVFFDKDFYTVSDLVTVTVTDANAVAPIEVVLSAPNGELETVVTTDLGNGVFVATIMTAPGDSMNDGILQVANGDTITARYADVDDGTGNGQFFTDTALIATYVEYPATDVPISITDNNTFTSIITVDDLGIVGDLNVKLDITHTFDADLDISLTAPNGQMIELFSDVGGSGDNFQVTYLDADADENLVDGEAPFDGSYVPEGDLNVFDEVSITGDWVLTVTDDSTIDQGTLNAWSLLIDVIPPTRGLLSLDSGSYNIGDTIQVELVDTNAFGFIDVMVESTSGDLEVLDLTGDGSGIYTGEIVVTTGTPNADGQVQARLGDLITFTYNDLDDGNGMTYTATTSANVQNIKTFHSDDIPISIVDNTTITSTLEITDSGLINDLNVGFDVTHSFDGDLDFFLVSPEGVRIHLIDRQGGGGDNFINTTLDDEASTAIADGSAPFTGSFVPAEPLDVMDTASITGIWTLEITDNAGADEGSLDAWSLTIDCMPDDSSIPGINITGPIEGVEEGDPGETSEAVFVITLSNAAEEQITIDYATTVAGYVDAATEGVDFTVVSGTAVFEPGETSLEVSVPVLGDRRAEVDEVFGVELDNLVGDAFISNTTVSTTINDDELYVVGTLIDVGTDDSPIEEGAIGISDQAYNDTRGFGWFNHTRMLLNDSGVGSDTIRDHAGVQTGEFAIDANNGTYTFTLHYGNVNRIDDFEVTIEGETFVVDPNRESDLIGSYTVDVNDGQANIEFDGTLGGFNKMRIAGIVMDEVAGRFTESLGNAWVETSRTLPTFGSNGFDVEHRNVMETIVVDKISGSLELAESSIVGDFERDSNTSPEEPVDNFDLIDEVVIEIFG